MTLVRCFPILLAVIAAAPGMANADDRAGAEFFEAKVRPLLAERCYGCHSAAAGKSKGELSLDTPEGVIKGGRSGAAVVPGKAGESRLIRAVRRVDVELQMPPKEPLSAAEVAVLERWVGMGAPDPRTGTAVATERREAWALKPVRAVAPPEVKDRKWPAGAIDRFVMARLEAAGLRPSPPAERRALLRRVTFDLTGLPPTPGEVEAFLADDAPAAYERVVDRLLASPRYGERWGRHWLDVVRYGESHGYEQNHLRDRAWPYRDYVIRAFNEDRPYPRFVEEQLAGDVVGAGDPAVEAATGFLVAGVHDTVGNNAEAAKRQQRADDLDDIVSTVGATFLGLTVGCARCHDHKFDPVPQADYYALAAVFAGVRHEERALPGPPTEAQQREAADLAERAEKVAAEVEAVQTAVRAGAPRPAVSARRNVEEFPPVEAKYVRFVVLATADGAEPCLDELEVYAAGGTKNLALATAGTVARASSLLPGHEIHQVAHLNDGRLGNDRSWISAERGRGWAQVELPEVQPVARVVWGRDGSAKPRFEDRVPVRYQVQVSKDGEAWETVATGDDRAVLSAEQRERLNRPRAEQASVEARQAAAAQGTLAYVGRFTPPDPVHLLRRGDVMQRTDVVPPAALSRVPGWPGELGLRSNAPESARRVALAKWIGDPRNPLTARVMVNRVWQYHFGRGLVGTPSDFGANGEAPTHPELLDWLADDFVRGGWTLKRVHRQIVLSRTYQQAGRPDDAALAAGLAKDGATRLLWRMPLRRLEAEAVRDSILATAGTLDVSPAAVGGPGFRLFKYRVVNVAIYEALADQGPQTWRRAVYQQPARNIRDDLMAAFDEPENAQRTPRREVTTNPLQALTLLHSPFVVGQAERFAERVRREAGEDLGRQAGRAFEVALGRPATEAERAGAIELVRSHGLAALCRALFNANEFLTH
jgi:hypothetical protein